MTKWLHANSEIGRLAPDFLGLFKKTARDVNLRPSFLGNQSTALIMGVLNITPDSFSDGGELFSSRGPNLDLILRRAEVMLADGAALLDIGGESTRPGAVLVSMQQELDRVVPVVEALVARLDAVLSVDTSCPQVMRQAIAAGAVMINDVRALSREGAMTAVAETGAAICLMHMQGEPADMQSKPEYQNVVEEVEISMLARASAVQAAGIAKGKIILDPGFGFGKTLAHNLLLFNAIPRLAGLGYPVLVGVSRKSMLGQITGRSVDQRVVASATMAALAIAAGASMVRVHDVAETADALRLVAALQEYGG